MGRPRIAVPRCPMMTLACELRRRAQSMRDHAHVQYERTRGGIDLSDVLEGARCFETAAEMAEAAARAERGKR